MIDEAKIGIIVSARTGSRRLPNKVLRELNEKPMVLFLLNRLRKSKSVSKVILATTLLPADDILYETVTQAGYDVYRGSENNLVNRYISAAEKYNIDNIIRVTGDCPFVNSEVIEYCIDAVSGEDYDIASTKGQFPIGIDCEIFSLEILKHLNGSERLSMDEKEHLTLGFYNRKQVYNKFNIKCKSSWVSQKTFTVDILEDLKRANEIAQSLGRSVKISELINYEKS